MFACPFQPPLARTLDFGGSIVATRRFEQRPGLAFNTANIPAQTPCASGDWPVHAHAQLAVVVKGKLRFHLPDLGWQTCPAGHWFAASFDATQVRFEAIGDVQIVWLECNQSVWEQIAPSQEPDQHIAIRCLSCSLRQEALLVAGAASPQLETLSRELYKLEGRDARERLMVEARSLEWLACLLDQSALSQPPRTEPCFRDVDQDALTKAAQILEENLDEAHTLAELSRRVFLNEFKLKKGFRERYKTTVFAFLRQKRVERGRQLLLTGQTSVIEAANAVGYSNPSHFARAFRAEYGINPSELNRS